MKYPRLLILLFALPASLCQGQFNFYFHPHLGRVTQSYTTNNIICANSNNQEILYLTPHLVTSQTAWKLGSIEYNKNSNEAGDTVVKENADNVLYTLKANECLNLRITYSGSSPGTYSMNLGLECVHNGGICDRTYQIKAIVPDSSETSAGSSLQWVGSLKIPNARNRLLFTGNQLLVMDGNSQLTVDGNSQLTGWQQPAFNLTDTSLSYSSTKPFSSTNFRPDCSCYKGNDLVIDNDPNGQIRLFNSQGEHLKTLNIPGCRSSSSRVSLSSRSCDERVFWICQDSLQYVDPASFQLNVTHINNYRNVDILAGASHYDSHYGDTLLFVNSSHVAVYQFVDGVLTELGRMASDIQFPTGRPGKPRAYGRDDSGKNLLRIEYPQQDQPMEETQFNVSDFENIRDIAVHDNGLIAVLDGSGNDIHLYRESRSMQMAASGLTAAFLLVLSMLTNL